MSILTPETPVIALPELDLFENIPIQTQIESTVTEEILPISQLNSGAHIEFIVKTHENEFIRPCEAMIQVAYRVKLRKTDATNIAAADWEKVSMINNAADSMFGQIDVSIGETQTTKPLFTHPYRAYIHTVLHAPEEAKKTFLKLRGFDDDDFSSEKIHKPQKKRIAHLKPESTATDQSISKKGEFWFPIHSDIFRQMKDLVGDITLKIRLIPSRPEFFFMTEDEKLIPSIHFEEVVLHLVSRNVNGSVVLGIREGLMRSPAKYPVDKVEVRTHTIDTGTTSRILDNIYNGTIPRFVLIAFVDNDAFSGSYTKNPFYFDHYDLGSISCYVNSVLINRRPFKPDHNLAYFGKEYINFLKVIGQLNNNITTTITPEQYKKGFFMIPWDLTRDGTQGYLTSGYSDAPTTDSNLRFAVTFNKPLEKTITAIIYCAWDGLNLIDNFRNAAVSAD